MYTCKISDIYDIEKEDYWQEKEGDFGMDPKTRWCVMITFLVKVTDDTGKLLKKKPVTYGDEIYAFVCSPAYLSRPNNEFYDGRGNPIVLDCFSVDAVKNAINAQLAPIQSAYIKGLFEAISTIFEVEEPFEQ